MRQLELEEIKEANEQCEDAHLPLAGERDIAMD